MQDVLDLLQLLVSALFQTEDELSVSSLQLLLLLLQSMGGPQLPEEVLVVLFTHEHLRATTSRRQQ